MGGDFDMSAFAHDLCYAIRTLRATSVDPFVALREEIRVSP
jgi:hypothetical protein